MEGRVASVLNFRINQLGGPGLSAHAVEILSAIPFDVLAHCFLGCPV